MKIYPVFIPHAGCPHTCFFCAQDKTSGQTTIPAVGDVKNWLEGVLPARGDGEIAFYGGSFSLLPASLREAYLAVAGKFVAGGRCSGIRISTRPDAVEEDLLRSLQRFGVTTIELGCQSFNDATLLASGRGHSAADNISAVQRCRQFAFQAGIQLMPGLPGDSAGVALQSLRSALQLEPDFLRIYPTLVVEGTKLAQLWRAADFIPWSLDQTVDLCADMLYLSHLAKVPVIRLGLHAEPGLQQNLLAGPFHPAFGQLVRCRLWRRALLYAGGECQCFQINPDDLSDVVGHRGENRIWLKNVRPALHWSTDRTVKRGFLRVAGADLSFLDLAAQGGQV